MVRVNKDGNMKIKNVQELIISKGGHLTIIKDKTTDFYQKHQWNKLEISNE